MKKKSKFFEEFKKFILRGNVMDMAVDRRWRFYGDCDIVECGYSDTNLRSVRRNGFLVSVCDTWKRRECTGTALW